MVGALRLPAFGCLTGVVLFCALAPLEARRPEAQTPTGPADSPLSKTLVSYREARRVLYELRHDLLPGELRGKPPSEQEAAWPAWISGHDAAVRARLLRGDEDSIVNLLLFGVSFTSQPRIDIRQMLKLVAESRDEELLTSAVLRRRIDDMIAALDSPGANDRLLFARDVIGRNGLAIATGNEALRLFLQNATRRVFAEYRESFGSRGTPAPYVDRGLSTDTSLLPNFAIEQALTAIKTGGLLGAGTVARVAVVGPGLDFADKRDGHDFYPVQSLQPFAILDSLRRLELSNPGGVRIVTFDLSPRINSHLDAARQRAAGGASYSLVVPRDASLPWRRDVTSYWQRFGDRIGTAIEAVRPPATAGAVEARSIRVRPDAVVSITPLDLNIVVERIETRSPVQGFDLIVATNVLTYYGPFEQSLALLNVASMLRPGGLLLSNDPLVVLPAVPLQQAGTTAVQYTDLSNSRDEVVWYQREPRGVASIRNGSGREATGLVN